MSLHFTVLASGSSGNASLLEADGFGLLIDAGLGPRLLASRLKAVDSTAQRVGAVLLTHTHNDHWNDRTLAQLKQQRVPLYCHAEHHTSLLENSPAFACLRIAGLVRPYELDTPLQLAPGLSCRPFQVSHDGGLTCGFRFEGDPDPLGRTCAVAYAADLGCWHPELARRLADVDLLALEFNHDVAMEYASGRSPQLIARVLGDQGHLSNVQAAALVRQVLKHSQPGRLRYLVQLHLSRQCNRPALALQAVGGLPPEVRVHAACQNRPGPRLAVGVPANGTARPVPVCVSELRESPAHEQRCLPGWDEDFPPMRRRRR
jgi:phosphoribosyl 1,2-cyclic phosphodiesterase